MAIIIRPASTARSPDLLEFTNKLLTLGVGAPRMVANLSFITELSNHFRAAPGTRCMRRFQLITTTLVFLAILASAVFAQVATSRLDGLVQDQSGAAQVRGVCLSELSTAVGHEICGEGLLSLSVGCAVYPADGMDAEKLLAEADRRMYMQKQQHQERRKTQTLPGRIFPFPAASSNWAP